MTIKSSLCFRQTAQGHSLSHLPVAGHVPCDWSIPPIAKGYVGLLRFFHNTLYLSRSFGGNGRAIYLSYRIEKSSWIYCCSIYVHFTTSLDLVIYKSEVPANKLSRIKSSTCLSGRVIVGHGQEFEFVLFANIPP